MSHSEWVQWDPLTAGPPWCPQWCSQWCPHGLGLGASFLDIRKNFFMEKALKRCNQLPMEVMGPSPIYMSCVNVTLRDRV